MQTRPVQVSDAADIIRLLTPEILEGFAHFGTTIPSVEEVETQIRKPFPWRVADIDGSVVGFCKTSPWKQRQAYSWTLEMGIFVDPTHHRRGIARQLVVDTMQQAESEGFRTLLCGIALPNPASIALCESLGFHPAGILERVGFKNGEWRDVGYWTKYVGQGPPTPRP